MQKIKYRRIPYFTIVGNQTVILCRRFFNILCIGDMGNSKIIIAIVVGIVVIKLVAVHFYLKTKIKQSEENQAKTKQRK